MSEVTVRQKVINYMNNKTTVESFSGYELDLVLQALINEAHKSDNPFSADAKDWLEGVLDGEPSDG